VYLPSWIIYHDVTLGAPARACCQGTYPEFTAIRRWPSTGRWLDPHPIGPAIMMTPFFLAADLATRLAGRPRDGFSIYYQHAAGLAGLAYLLVGLAVLRRLLARHFEAVIVLATLVTVTWGTNLFHYGTYDSVFSHVFSFCLIVSLLALTDAWWSRATPGRALAVGLIGALMFLTRHTNAMFLLIVPLYGVVDAPTLRARAPELWARRGSIAIMTAAAALGALPQLLIYKLATGFWFVSPYSALDAGFTFAAPHLFGVLFSTQKGLFFWSPALLFAVAGFFVARRWARALLLPSVLVLAVNTYLIASWFDWQFGGSFSHRGFTDSLGVFAVFMAAFFAWAAGRPRVRDWVAIVTTVVVLLSVAQMIQYWQGVLPIANTTWPQYKDAFLRFH
jgi:hypothetical protein